jgi:hypothetical protein
MTAKPIQPGRTYRVRGNGLDVVILASNPCAAICVAVEILTKRSQ